MSEAGSGSPPGRGTDRRWLLLLLAAAALPCIGLAAAELYLFGDFDGFSLDDAWIHLRFAEQLAGGAGLAYNDGELVAASTAPLWTVLLALLAPLPGALPVWAKAAGVAAQLAAVAAAYRLGRALDLPLRWAALGALLVAVTDWLVHSSLSGMEVGLFTALSLAALARYLSERSAPARPPVSWLLFALAALARPEGLLLPVLAALDTLVAAAPGGGLRLARERWRYLALGIAAALLVVVPVGLAYQAMSGSPLPTTFSAKSSGPPAFVPELRFLRTIFGILLPSQPVPVLAAAGGALVLAARLGGRRDRGLLLPLWAFGMPVAAAMLSSGRELLVGNFGRYFFPLLPCYVLLGLIALEGARGAPLARLRLGRVELPLWVLGLAVLVGPPLLQTVRGGAVYLQARANVEDSDEQVARWLESRVPPDALLGLCDVGYVKYRLPNPVLDMAGLIAPDRQRFLREMARAQGLSWHDSLLRWVEQKRPEYVVLYPSWFPLYEREPERFPVLLRIAIPNNIAMGGNELVVYATPWTRPSALGAR